MSKFQSAIGTISALVTISVTVGTVYYNVENKKSQDVTQQEQINQLQQKLNESKPVEEPQADSYTSTISPQSTPEPSIPTPPELPVVQSIPQPSSPPAPPVTTVPPVPPAPPVAQIQSVEIK